MANGSPTPGAARALKAAGGASPFNADERAKSRENSPVTIAERSFTRRRKDWGVNRAMRRIMRVQESAVARGNRLKVRVGELEAEQMEAAAKGEDGKVDELESTITTLVEKSDDALEEAELVTYRLLALLLVPPPASSDTDPGMQGFGPDHWESVEAAGEAIAFLQRELDVQDAIDLAQEISGSAEPDPPETPSSESSST